MNTKTKENLLPRSDEFNSELEQPSNKLQRLQNHYLDLMQSCLTGSIYRDSSNAPFVEPSFDAHRREYGLDWPAQAQTMIGAKRMDNLRILVESVLREQIPGDFIETGVWRGGACIFMRAILSAYNITDRCVWVADSFEGLPTANSSLYPEDANSDFHTYAELAVPLQQVQENFESFGFLDQQTKFLKGWFKDTLPTVAADQFALIRLDGDMYESTMDALTSLYPKLAHNGYVIIDDYEAVPACKKAVHDYFESMNINPHITEIDGTGIYWKKIDVEKKDSQDKPTWQPTKEPEDQIYRLNERLINLNKIIINYATQKILNQDEEATILRENLLARDNEITTLSNEITTLQKNVLLMQQSASWRVTQPLRTMKAIFMKFFKT